jgi:uncharacterized protein YegL
MNTRFLLLGAIALMGCNGKAEAPLDPRAPASGTPTPAPSASAATGWDGRPQGGDLPNLVPRLDPNARYATTYRPGGAALSAFDDAVARGAIPPVYKDLVGDFGARYAPSLARPEGALALQVDTERAEQSPAGGLLNLRIAMRSSDAIVTHAPMSVHLVLDVSGSMSGAAIENAKKAAQALVLKLDPLDDFSMVTFSNEADVLVPDGPVGRRRKDIMAKIGTVRADGGTNISAGLDLAYRQAHAGQIDADAIKIVMLLSDGHANAGDTSPTSLAERAEHAFQDGVQTSAFGLGSDFDAPLMSSIADHGAGGYYYLADSTQIAPALTRELDARLVPVAQAVELRVRLRPDVTPLKVFGSHMLDGAESSGVRRQELAVDRLVHKTDRIEEDRADDAGGGMRFFMPAFARDDRHAMMMTLRLPPGVGERAIGSVEIRYKDRVLKKNMTQEVRVATRYADSEARSTASTNASVQATLEAFAAGEAILAAAAKVDHGDREGAAKLLEERSDLLRQTSTRLAAPSLADDSARLARLARAVSGAEQVADPVPLAVMLRGSAYAYLR